ncbi:MAG: type II glyceraldehyde-3-phosphate dehydrogenase [Thermoplasmataceae archaeon]
MIKVGINGYGTIGRRVADAVRLQKDMTVVGIVKTKPDYIAKQASESFNVFANNSENLKNFENSGVVAKGTMEELVQSVDVMVDCTPEGMGEKNRELYKKYKVKGIFQGGEEPTVAEQSFNAYSSYDKCKGKDFLRVVSCNTTGLARTIFPLMKSFGVKSIDATLIRRATDPNDSKKGPINAIEPSLKFPSHHGPDLKTVLDCTDISTVAIKVPTTLMHVHSVHLTTNSDATKEKILEEWSKFNRVMLVSGKSGISSTSQVMDLAREFGRKRGDLFEIAVWKESVFSSGYNIRYIQAVHQESDVVPENIDAIRSIMGYPDREKSISETDNTMGIFRREL